MGNSSTETLNLIFLAQTAQARLYRHSRLNAEQWIPASVCPKTFKHGTNRGDIHEVTIESWWLEQNPFVRRESEGQASLFDE